MSELHVLRVFTAPSGEHGNPLGVFLDGAEVPEDERQAFARDLGFSETVFVDEMVSGPPLRGACIEIERAEMRIFTPEVELPFAGHPTVGVAWLLREARGEVAVLRPPAGDLHVRYENDLTWIAARPEWSPPFSYPELGSATEVDALDGPLGERWVYTWAWDDEEAGRVRARAFIAEAGITEDEATGSAALTLCAQLERPIQVRQGEGSEIFARPVNDGYVEVGGRVVLDEVRAYPTVESR